MKVNKATRRTSLWKGASLSLGATVLLGFLGASVQNASAQYLITTANLNTAVLYEDFNSYRGNASTVPSNGNWTINGFNNSYRGVGNGSSTSGGLWAYGVNNDDRSFGFLGNSGTRNQNATAQFQNTSGATITSFVLSFTGEEWRRISAQASQITIFYGTTLAGATTALGNSTWLPTNGANSSGSLISSATITADNTVVSIANGESIFIRWAYQGGSSGTREGLSFDDISVTFNGEAPPAATGNFWVGNDTVLGGDGTWANTGGTSWRSDNTDGTGAPFTPAETANFGGASGGAVSVSGTVTPQAGINFATTGYVLSGGTIDLAGANAAANTITTATAVSATINSQISGSNGMTKAGAGTLVLGGSNTYSGETAISSGALEIRSSNALGATGASNGVTVSSGAALQLSNNIAVGNEPITISGTGISNGGAIQNLSGANSFGGPITLAANSRIGSDAGTLSLTSGSPITGAFALTVGGAGDIVIDSGIASSLTSLTKDGAGTVTLNGASASTGATTISTGTFALGSSGTLASTSISVASGATLDVSSKASGYALGNGVTLSGAGTVETASGQALTINNGATIAPGTTTTSATFNVTGGLDFASGGTYNFTLTSVSGAEGAASGWDLISISNALNISATSGDRFTFNINSSGSTGFSNTTSYAWVVANAASITNFSADKFAFVNNIPASNGAFSLSSNGTSLTLNYAAGTTLPILWSSSGGSAWLTGSNWVGGVVPGASEVAQFGANPSGTLAGINMNSNSGSQQVGAIEVTSDRANMLNVRNSAGSAAGVLTLNGATVNSVANVILWNGSDQELLLSNGSGSATMGVALGGTNNVVVVAGAGDIAISSIVSGAGNITLQGAGDGSLILSGANTYEGGTTISEGTLNAANASALGTGAVSVAGGTLATTVANVNTGNLTLSSGTLNLNGTSTGTITLSTDADLVLSGGTWNFSFTNASSFDSIIGGGAGSTFTITGSIFHALSSIADGSYAIMTAFGTGTGTFSAFTGLDAGQSASTTFNNGVLTLVVIPEPHEYALMFAGLLGLVIVLRRMRRNPSATA